TPYRPVPEHADWLPAGLVLALGSDRGRHGGMVRAVAFSPDDGWVASAGDDGFICVLDAQTLELHRALRGHVGAVNALTFSADGKRILSGGADKTVRLWDVEGHKELLKLAGDKGGHTDPVVCVAISSDGKRAVSGASGAIDH